MTRQDKITAATPLCGNLAGAVSPRAAPATLSEIGAASNRTRACGETAHGPTGEAGAPNLSTCPDCSGPFSYRIRDEDTGCSYPVDDGEHYCDACDSLFTDEYLAGTEWKAPTWLAEGWARVEL